VKWTATIRPKAKADLTEAHDWYEERRPGLGDEFLADLAEALLRLEADPERYPVYYRGFRRVLAHRFPYKIFFRIAGQNIIVFRILHGAQNHPRKLRP
jgi:plasmid stabilization system protein ParE